MKNSKTIIVISLVAATMAISFALPRVKYTSTNILTKLSIPDRVYNWYGRDVSDKLNAEDMKYNFISQVFARTYDNGFGRSFLLLILDAGNFHNPKVCFGGSGYTTRDLPDIEIKTANNTFKAKALFLKRPEDSLVMVYWICIDRQITDWTGQKIKELWYSIFNKKKSGLMIRFDMPSVESDIDGSLKFVKGFIEGLSNSISKEQAEYLFGK